MIPQFWDYRVRVGNPPPKGAKSVTDRLPRKVKRHFLECELKTADGLISDYVEYVEEMDICDVGASATRQKLIWLLERLQESVL